MTEHLAAALGKGIRTKLLMACAMDSRGFVPKDTVYAAAAVEMFHLATLVHDDIIDDAKTRRGIQSVHARFSKKEAVICGDYLLCVSIYAISTIHTPYTHLIEKFSKIVSQVCLGELRQLSNHTDMGFFDYLRTIHGKTAALFRISAYAGGVLSSAEPSEINRLSKFGTYLGMMFQMIDDCKDYLLSEREALKPTKSDIAAGVINLPLLMSFLKEPGLRHMAKEAIQGACNYHSIFDEVHRLGGVPATFDIILKYEKKAMKILRSLENSQKSAVLEEILRPQVEVVSQRLLNTTYV